MRRIGRLASPDKTPPNDLQHYMEAVSSLRLWVSRLQEDVALSEVRVRELTEALRDCKRIAEADTTDSPVFVLPNKIAARVEAVLNRDKQPVGSTGNNPKTVA